MKISLLLNRGKALADRCRMALTAAADHPVMRQVSRQMMKRRRTVAVTGSVLLHLLALLLFLPSVQRGGFSAGGSIGDGMGAGEGIDLTLYDIAQPAPASLAVKAPDAEDLEELTELSVAELSDESLLEVSDTQLSDMATVKVIALSSVPPSVSETESQANRGATGTGGLTQGSGDDLWAAIAPCWKQMSDEHTVPVALEVTFSAGGGLAEPPVIKRADGKASDPQVLTSESKAIQALAACGVYPMAAGQQKVAINFPAP